MGTTFDVGQNNWILFPDVFPCPNYAEKVRLDIDIELRRTPTFNRLDDRFWDAHFQSYSFADLKHKCAALGIQPEGRKKLDCVRELTRYFRKLINA